MQRLRFAGVSSAVIIIQVVGGGADTAIQNFLVYEAGILNYGVVEGYIYAGCIGGFINIIIGFALKLWLFWGNNWQLGAVAKGYGILRFKLAVAGGAIAYLPLFIGVPYYLSSWSSFIFSLIVIVIKAPAIFGEKYQ